MLPNSYSHDLRQLCLLLRELAVRINFALTGHRQGFKVESGRSAENNNVTARAYSRPMQTCKPTVPSAPQRSSSSGKAHKSGSANQTPAFNKNQK